MRQLPQELKEFLDSRIPADERQIEPAQLLLKAAAVCIGITNESPMVDLFRSVVAKPQKEAWCVDFMQACIAYVESTLSIVSLLPATESAYELWQRGKIYSAISPPKPGDIIVWQLGNTMRGHCGMLTGQNSLLYFTIEGNTSEQVGIDRDGGGVYAKKRTKGGTLTFTELGFLRCFM